MQSCGASTFTWLGLRTTMKILRRHSRAHQRYLSDARVARAKWIIDLACGPGKFSAFVARHTQGHVLGIDLSEVQLAKAREYMRDNLIFLQHDIMRVDALRQRFDAAFLLDAACYLPSGRSHVLQTFGIRELLRRLSLEDLLLRGGRQAMILKDQYYANVFPKLAADAGALRYGYIVAEKRPE